MIYTRLTFKLAITCSVFHLWLRAMRYELAAMIMLVSSNHTMSQYGQWDGLLNNLRCRSNGIEGMIFSTRVSYSLSVPYKDCFLVQKFVFPRRGHGSPLHVPMHSLGS